MCVAGGGVLRGTEGDDWAWQELDADTSQEELLDVVRELNADPAVDGILVQLPLPDHIDQGDILEAIDIDKDGACCGCCRFACVCVSAHSIRTCEGAESGGFSAPPPPMLQSTAFIQLTWGSWRGLVKT